MIKKKQIVYSIYKENVIKVKNASIIITLQKAINSLTFQDIKFINIKIMDFKQIIKILISLNNKMSRMIKDRNLENQ